MSVLQNKGVITHPLLLFWVGMRVEGVTAFPRSPCRETGARPQSLDHSITLSGLLQELAAKNHVSRWPKQLVHVCLQKGGPQGPLGLCPSFPAGGDKQSRRARSQAGPGGRGAPPALAGHLLRGQD